MQYKYSDSYRNVMSDMQFVAHYEGERSVCRRHLYLALERIVPGLIGRLLGDASLLLPAEYTQVKEDEPSSFASLAISSTLWRVISIEGGILGDVVAVCGGGSAFPVSAEHLAAAYLLDENENGIRGYLLATGVDNTSSEFRTGVIGRLKELVVANENGKREDSYRAVLEKVARIKARMRERIVGQARAIDLATSALADFWTRPVGADMRPLSFFLTGEHGAGKSKFAEELADAISEENAGVCVTRLDGGFYAGDNVARDLVGYDNSWKCPRSGDMTSPILDCPGGVVLFDNIESMNPIALNFVRRALSTGVLRDAYSEEDVNFSQAIFIFMSAAGGEFVTKEEIEHCGENISVLRQRLLEGLTSEACGIVASNLTTMITQCTSIIPLPPLSVSEIRELTERHVEHAAKELRRFAKNVVVDTEGVTSLMLQSYPSLNAGCVEADVSNTLLAPIRKKFEDSPNIYGGLHSIEVSLKGCKPVSNEEIERRLKARRHVRFSTSGARIEKRRRLRIELTANGVETLPAVQDGIVTVGTASEKDSFESLVGVDRPREYLEKWKRYFESNDKACLRPEHIILSGKPGTGKTSVVRAAANMMGLPYMSLTCTDLSSAASVKNVFSKIRKYGGDGGIIVLLDEIDSIAEDRDGKDPAYIERLNTFLQEVSGYTDSSKALFIAATNRIGAIDSAVTRCGRFGQTFEFGDLTTNERTALIEMTTRELKQDELEEGLKTFVAETTRGNAPVTIKSILRELFMSTEPGNRDRAAYLAARHRVINGVSNSVREPLNEGELRQVAAHEAGHAVMFYLIEPNRRFVQTAICPDGSADTLGYLEHFNRDSVFDHTKEGIERRIDVALAGSVAQSMLSRMSDGGVSDLEMATGFAMNYIRAGFCEEYGLAICDADLRSPVYFEQARPHLNKILMARRKIVRETLERNVGFLEKVTEALVKRHVLLYEEVAALSKECGTSPVLECGRSKDHG